MALPLAAADAVGEAGHLVEHRVHVGDDVLPVHDDRGVPRRAQGDMQDRAVLGDVDPVAPEHGVDPLAQAAFPGQLQEEPQRVVGDAVLRVVEEEAGGLDCQTLAAFGILREQRAEMDVPDLFVVGDERFPRRA